MPANAFERIKKGLERRPHIPFSESDNELAVPAADESGFDVAITKDEVPQSEMNQWSHLGDLNPEPPLYESADAFP